MQIDAITEDATGLVLQWGISPIRAPAAGESLQVITDVNSPLVIRAVGNKYTKVVSGAFVEMTQVEKDAVDAVNRVAYDYGNVAGAFTLDLTKGVDQSITLTASLTAADLVSFVFPTGAKTVTLRIRQDAVGGHTISADAWSSRMTWGTQGAPALGGLANSWQFVTLHYYGDSVVCGHYDTNVFNYGAGASLAAWYRWDAYTLGTPPDIAIATNLQGDALLNLSQSVESQRPHLVGQTWEFDRAASMALVVSGLATPVLLQGDFATILCVAKFDVTSTGNTLVEVSPGITANLGCSLFAAGDLVKARFRVLGSALPEATVAADNEWHVYRATLTPAGVELAIDGVVVATDVLANTGLYQDLDTINMGVAADNLSNLDGQIKETVVLRNPTLAQYTDDETRLIQMYRKYTIGMISTTAYTLTASDFGGPPLVFDAATAIALSIDIGLGRPIEPCNIIQYGAGQITVGGTALPVGSNGLKSRAQNSMIILACVDEDTYVLGGDTTA